MSVDTAHPSYSSMTSEWKKMGDVCSCQQTIYNNSELYLKKLSKMTDDEYEAYMGRASFVMFTGRAIEAFSGMVMRKDVAVEGYIPENIDGKGGSINTYTKTILDEYLTYTRAGTLVDLPNDTSVVTVADEIEKNIKSRFLFYDHDSIINWKTKLINNVEVLSLVTLKENIDAAENEFEHEIKFQYRVLSLDNDGYYNQRIYNHDKDLVNQTYPKMNGDYMKYIPFKIHGGYKVKYPILLGVADQNIKHYQLDAHYQHGLHFVALPTPYLKSDMDPTKESLPDTLGPTEIWYIPTDAEPGMLEFTGAGLNEFSKAKEEKVDTIIILTSRILAPEKSSNDESALAAAIRNNAETSTLAGVTKMLSKDFTELAKIAAMWDGEDTDIKIKINSDFMPSNLSGTDMLSYVTAWIKGGISYDSLFQILKDGEIIQGDRDIIDELKDIDEEQKKRLKDEVDKAEKMGEVEGDDDSDGELIPNVDPEKNTKLSMQLK